MQGSTIGKLLFGPAFSKLLQGKFSYVIARKILELQAVDITLETLQRNRAQFLEELQAIGKDPMEASPTREVELRYRGALVPTKVTRTYDEYSMWVTAVTHGIAVDRGTLRPLFCEHELVPPRRPAPAIAVSPEVTKAAAAARLAAEELLKGKVQSAIVIQTALDTHAPVLMQLDRQFRLEVAFFKSVSANGAQKRLKDEVLSCLPGHGQIFTETDSLEYLHRLGNSKLIEFCGVGLQATFRSVVSVVEAIKNKLSPAYDATSMSSFMTDIMYRMAYFCEHTNPAGSDAPLVKFVPQPGAVAVHESLKAKFDSGDGLSLREISAIVPFAWLVGDGAHSDIKKWTNAAMRADIVASATAAVAAAPEAAPKAGRKKVCADARASVMAVLKD